MKKHLIRILMTMIWSLSFIYNAKATHTAGVDLTYIFVDSASGVYRYRVTLSLYQDCLNGSPVAIAADNPAYLGIYNGADSLILMDSIYNLSDSAMPMAFGTPCNDSTLRVCRLKAIFVKDYFLPLSATGYTFVYQRCCLNAAIGNLTDPGNDGLTLFCSIPPAGITTHNNSAIFINYPPVVIGNNAPLVFDCSATDADGDSLSYGFFSPLNCCGGSVSIAKPLPAPPPYDTLAFITPLSFNDPMYCSTALNLDPVTGLLTGTPNATGTYLMTVYCNEWRSGALVNTIHREFEFIVADCALSSPDLAKEQVLELHPNPTKNSLSITSSCPIIDISITNLIGQTVYNHENNTNKVQVDVAGLPAGVYFIRINRAEVRKFVKE